VPAELDVTFDFRLGVEEDHVQFENQLKDWCTQAGGGITIDYILKEPKTPATAIDASNPYWMAMKNVFDKMYVFRLSRTSYHKLNNRALRGVLSFSVIFNMAQSA